MPATDINSVSLLNGSSNEAKIRLQCRIVILGAARSGKTAIVHRFLYDTFPEHHKATVEELYRAEFQLRSSGRIILDVLDTSGTYAFPAMRRLAIAQGDAFILVYAVDDSESFEEAGRLKDLIMEERALNGQSTIPPIVVVGNKCDLDESRRVINRKLAETIITCDWEVSFIEASAKSSENVVKIFQKLLLQSPCPNLHSLARSIAVGNHFLTFR